MIYYRILKLFKVRTIKLPGITSYVYEKERPSEEVIIKNPYASDELKEGFSTKVTLPEPFLLLNRKQTARKDTVVVFGDTSIEETYSQYIDGHDIYKNKWREFVEQLKISYKDCTLLYKPHLSDKGRVTDDIDPAVFTIYKEQKDAEMLLIDNLDRIKAVYAFFSSSSVTASLMRIPSYHIFKYFLNDKGALKLDDLAQKMGWYANPYYKKLVSLDEVGCIDSVSIKTDMENAWRKRWLEFLK